jgi:hypothetical protein
MFVGKNKKRKTLSKILEWIKRYLPAEILAIMGALAGGMITHFLFHNQVITALGGTWGENIGFYGKILYSDIRDRSLRDERITFVGMLKVLRNIVIEFGPGEYLDSFVIRPAAMYFFPKVTGNVVLGLFLGKISADVTFYLPTIIAYEFRKKYFKD